MDSPAGLTSTKMNHRSRGNRSNQCVRLFIDYLYVYTFHHQKHTKVHQQTLGARTRTEIKAEHRDADNGLGERGSSALEKRGGALREGEGNLPGNMTPHCRIVQYRRLQSQ